jgi:hypothetical protein
MELAEIRVRSKIPKAELDKKIGKILTEGDYNIRLTGPTKVYMPDGKPLIIYLPGILTGQAHAEAYDVLHTIQGNNNRKNAGGAGVFTTNNRSRPAQVSSSIIGSIDPIAAVPFCRTTAWTGHNTAAFQSLFPLFETIDATFAEYVPDRYSAQKARANSTHPDWLVGNTVYTTMTVNNTFPTGVHTDKGDLDAGFSCLAVWRRGDYSGGHLTFPEWRVSVDLQDGDLILMDAHQWHGNTALNLRSKDAERISLVLYYRTKMMGCDTVEEEADKAVTAKKRPLGGRAMWNAGGVGPVVFPTMDKEAMDEAVITPEA